MILIPLSDHPYYLWQALTQAVEMRRLQLPATYLVYTQGAAPSDRLRRIMDAGLADWHVWTDWRTEKVYNAAMKPALVGAWLTAHPEHEATQLTIIDPDCIPTRAPAGDVTATRWVGTDTDSYSGPGYLRSKPGVWEMLCDLVGVDPDRADRPGVGAQVTATGQPGEFWTTVAEKSVAAYHAMQASGTDVQAWCAEMYVTALECARRGIDLDPDPAYAMTWANGPASGWHDSGFHHSAGVTADNGRDFCKISHQVSPWGKPLTVHPDSASARYVDLIRAVEEQHPDLIWVE